MPSRTTSPMASHSHSKRKTKQAKNNNKNNNSNNNNKNITDIASTEQVAKEDVEANTDNQDNNNNGNESASMLLALQTTSPQSGTSSPTSSRPASPTLSTSSSASSTSNTSTSTTTTTTTSSATTDQNTSGGEENTTTTGEAKCILNDCALCVRGVPMLLVRSPTWASIMRVVFFCLQYDKKDKVFFNLKTDIYGFIISHWNKLSLNKKRSDNWHKQIQDMLSHSKNLFESGMEKYKQNGFWRMKQNHDPWTMHKPRSYNWTKRANRSLTDGADSEYITVFDVNTGAVVQDEDLESPRKKLRGDDDSSDDQKQSLEEEIRTLKDALAEMTENLSAVKEELKRKDQEMMEKAYTYQKTMEQLETLKLAHSQGQADMVQTIDREASAPSHSAPSSPPQTWPESYSPRTAYRPNTYSSPPPPPTSHSSRPLEPTHYPTHLAPSFPPSTRAIFSPFELPSHSSPPNRRYSPPTLPFPQHQQDSTHSPYLPPHYSSPYTQPQYDYKKYPKFISYFISAEHYPPHHPPPRPPP